MTKLRERQIEKRKQETLDVAMRLLIERGYNNFNMDELADAAGISKPTVYQYFNSKDELLAHALMRMFEKLEDRFSEYDDRPPLERLEHSLRTMLRARHETFAALGMAELGVMRSIFQRYPEMIERLSKARAQLGEIIQAAQVAGEIDPEVPWWVVLNMMFGFLGATSNRFSPTEGPHTPEELSPVIEAILRMFRRAVRAETPVTTPPQ